jgi:hypothetical protein
MGQKIATSLLFVIVLSFASKTVVSPSYAEPAKLAKVVYITLSKACNCTLERCQAGDWVVERVFKGEKQALLKRFDYATDKSAVQEYVSKYHLPMPPALLFLDKDGNLLWRADGELDLDLVKQKLNEFGA